MDDKRLRTTAMVDGLLKFLLAGGVITSAIVAPNSLQALDKPLRITLAKFDARERERELKRVLNYMKRKDYIRSADYNNGILITPAGRAKAQKFNISNLAITIPESWDKQWRIVFFDIPEKFRNQRINFSYHLRRLGFKPLQLSTWIFPHPARQEIEALVLHLGIQKFVTYIETSYIDNDASLKTRFKNIIS
ncbi:MAG: hypothetical protein ACXWLH_00715 [Candidatus Saccharimonadales bacterium]